MNQRLDFPGTEKMETMDRLAVSKVKKLLKQRLDFFRKRKDSKYG